MTPGLKELLELAAKAAGIPLHPEPFFTDGLTMRHGDGVQCWNPATSDGDSRRLQVALELTLVPAWRSGGYSRARCDHIPSGRRGPWVEDIADPLEACRMAVLHAAADIGRSMP